MNTKYRQKLTLILFLAAILSYSMSAHALGVGSLSVHSKLNQKLDAQIELLSTDGVNPSQIKASLAKASIFERAGVDYSPTLRNIDITVATKESGIPYIKMSSHSPIKEPIIDLILEVKWQQQRLLRKFTIMLDPAPIAKAPKPQTSTMAVQRTLPVKPTPAVAPQPKTPAPAKRQTKQNVAAENSSIKTYEVKTSKDTLWSIATRFRPDSSYSMQQVMAEILRQNPSAFLNNDINRLKTGSILRFDPSKLTGQTATTTKAKAETKPVKAIAAKPAPAQPKQQSATSGEIKTHKVKSRETLWSIATRLRPDSSYSIKQVMNALLTQNPDAFHNGDISQLKKGVTLKLDTGLLSGSGPTVASVKRKEPATTVSKTTKHVQVTPLPAPDTGAPEPIEHKQAHSEGIDKTQQLSATAAALLQTIDKIQQQIIEMQNLLKDKQAELLQLKREAQLHLAKNTPAPAPVVAAPQTPAQAATQPLESKPAPLSPPAPAPTKPVFNQEAPPQQAQQTQIERAPAPDTVKNTPPPQPSAPVNVIEHTNKQQEGFLGSLMSNPQLMIGLGGAVLLGLAGMYLYRRSRKKDEEEFDIDDEDIDDSLVDIDYDEDQPSAFDKQLKQSQEQEAQKPEIATDMSSGEGVQLDSDLRALYEADIYIACQRYNRAEESLINAIELNPERIEIKLKLLEVYLATQDRDKFISQAEIIHSKVDEDDPKWQEVVDMGKQLCPDYPLFGGDQDNSPLSEEFPSPSDDDLSSQADGPQENFHSDNSDASDPNSIDDFTGGIDKNDDEKLAFNLEEDTSKDDDLFKTDHDSSIDLDDSDLFAGQTEQTSDQETNLSSILLDSEDEDHSPPKKPSDDRLDDDDLAFSKA